MKPMTPLVLLKPHTHANQIFAINERIEVDDASAQWLIANGIATPEPKPLKTEPEPKPFQHKEPKP